MRILISGASGFIGASLSSHLKKEGHEVWALVRSNAPLLTKAISWDPEKGKAEKGLFEGFDGVIHLAGEPLSLSRWGREKREKILFSRTVGTWFLSQILSQLLRPPQVFISASAVGFYGDRGEELLTEESRAGRGFLANVCCEWEKGSHSLEERGTRVVRTRFGMVIGPHGGALKKMIPLYKMGLGAILGSGEQWISWIALQDLIRAIDHLFRSPLEGAVNFVSPYPVRQKEFAKTVAHLLHRPLLLRVPSLFLHLALGLVADEMLLASQRAHPAKLTQSGFGFRYSMLEDALRASLL